MKDKGVQVLQRKRQKMTKTMMLQMTLDFNLLIWFKHWLLTDYCYKYAGTSDQEHVF